MNEEIIETIEKLIREFPNDTELGEEVRKFFNSKKNLKQDNIDEEWDSTRGY